MLTNLPIYFVVFRIVIIVSLCFQMHFKNGSSLPLVNVDIFPKSFKVAYIFASSLIASRLLGMILIELYMVSLDNFKWYKSLQAQGRVLTSCGILKLCEART